VPVCASCGQASEGVFAFCPHCGAQLSSALSVREERKVVSILFCDVTGSTALGETLDPEALRTLLARYFWRMKAIVERHGGVVEKFIGDAVMAVFGIPAAHEDDALRAVRAAAEMREALPGLGIEGRIGVNTGEVVTGTEERLATGDAVNVAVRLQQEAAPGEVLIGELTGRLVHGAAEYERVGALRLKGKSEPVPVHRLVRVGEPPERRHESVFVGREREVEVVRQAWDRALGSRHCELVTVLGDPGIGKSRLVAECLRSLGARVVRGRCLSYGEGITYRPVVEIVGELAALPEDPRAAGAIRSVVGDSGEPTSTDEIAWAFRKLLEEQAQEHPLAVVVDDLQWGEETFLDLVEHVAVRARDAPILLVGLARPELLDRRPQWPVSLRLAPLGAREVGLLIPEEMGGLLRERMVRASGGNPLFVCELLAMADTTEGDVLVPPTLQALLTARLDQLDTSERRVLECGAVEGESFHRGAVATLLPEEREVGAGLVGLVRRELVRRERARIPGEDGYRFSHLLVRDAAYETMAKAARADLHERFAAWLQGRAPGLADLDEILGYHLGQAHDYRCDLGLHDDHTDRLGARSAELLAGAGARALGRNDIHAGRKLLERALALHDPRDPGIPLRLDLIQALLLSGRLEDAANAAVDAADRAVRAGDEVGALRARLMGARIATQMPRTEPDAQSASAALVAIAEEARPLFARAHDDSALTEAWFAIAWAQLVRCRWAAMMEAVEHALEHAQRARSARWERELPAWMGTALFYGPTPVAEVLCWYEEARAQHPIALTQQAVLEAMLGNFDRARTLAASADAIADELGQSLWLAAGGIALWEVETLAGDAAAAEVASRRSRDLLEALGDTGHRSLASAQLAASLCTLGRLDEAEECARAAEELSAVDDVSSQMLWREVRARLLARRGASDEAVRLACEAVSLAEDTDMLNWHGRACVDLAEVYTLAGRSADAHAQLDDALDLYSRKGNVIAASDVRTRLAELGASSGLVPRAEAE
jgi:class 3 adenylate cyclase/tetratricopeptide (TPR) repeat protein